MKELILFKTTEGLQPSDATIGTIARAGESCDWFHEVSRGNSVSEIDIGAEGGATLNAVVFQNVPAGENALIRIRVGVKADSTVRLTVVQNGASKAEIEILSDSSAANARFELRALQNAKERQNFVIRANSVHSVPHTSSDMQVWCAARGESRSVFSGLIDIREGARQTEAFQKNRNLILSDRATVDSFPKLLIANDDVKCAHGSSTSTLDPEQTAYLRSRGISRSEAEEMLVRGFLRQALDGIRDTRCRNGLLQSLSILEEEWS